MRDIKLVVYLKDVDEEDERLIENYLMDKGSTSIKIYTVDPNRETIKRQGKVIDEQNALLEEYVTELEELRK